VAFAPVPPPSARDAVVPPAARGSASAEAPGAAAPETEPPPEISVHIGRIEVRGEPGRAERARRPRPPRLTLDGYLAQRRKGER
jgi:hypothetical protein